MINMLKKPFLTGSVGSGINKSKAFTLPQALNSIDNNKSHSKSECDLNSAFGNDSNPNLIADEKSNIKDDNENNNTQ